VSAWACENRLILGQTKVNCKSNEITAIPALLETLDLSGCIISKPKSFYQKAIPIKH
jgi:predicted transposase YbfD/YdcC